MKTTLEHVKDFHETFRHPVADEPDFSNEELVQLRIRLLEEELEEIKEAVKNNDKVNCLKELCDLQYVLDGFMLALGFWKWKDVAFNEVQRSNMSKLGEDGKPIYREDGKVLKGPNYSPPDLASVLNQRMLF